MAQIPLSPGLMTARWRVAMSEMRVDAVANITEGSSHDSEEPVHKEIHELQWSALTGHCPHHEKSHWSVHDRFGYV
jgi:hypothetical protein